MAFGTWRQVFKGDFGFIIVVDILRGNRCFCVFLFLFNQISYVTEVDMDIVLLLITINKMNIKLRVIW